MTSVLLTGSRGAGKDAVADFLVQDYGYTKLALADALRWELAEMLAGGRYPDAWPGDEGMYRARNFWCKQLFVLLKEQGPTKDLLRGLLQWWGTQVRRAQDEGYWVKRIKIEIEALWSDGRGPFVISDVSFQNEMDAFPGWLKVRVYDPRRLVNATEHDSECGRAKLPVEYTLVNDGSLADLRDEVSELMLSMLSAQAAGGV